MNMTTKDTWKVLDPQVHGPLIANLKGYSKDAGIDPKWVDQPLTTMVDGGEVFDWLRKFRKSNVNGLLIENKSNKDSTDLCSAMSAALMRNFIQTRMLTQTEFIDRVKAGTGVWETCVFVPNFFMSSNAVSTPDWITAYLLDGLIMLGKMNRRVVLVTEDKEKMAMAYGSSLKKYLSMNFQTVQLVK